MAPIWGYRNQAHRIPGRSYRNLSEHRNRWDRRVDQWDCCGRVRIRVAPARPWCGPTANREIDNLPLPYPTVRLHHMHPTVSSLISTERHRIREKRTMDKFWGYFNHTHINPMISPSSTAESSPYIIQLFLSISVPYTTVPSGRNLRAHCAGRRTASALPYLRLLRPFREWACRNRHSACAMRPERGVEIHQSWIWPIELPYSIVSASSHYTTESAPSQSVSLTTMAALSSTES